MSSQPNQPNQPIAERLAGKVALVTGAAQGIGLAVATRFHAEGASVVVADVDDDAIVAAAASIDADQDRATPVGCDVTEPARVSAAVEAVVERHGRLDILFNNAAARTAPHTVATISLDDWNEALAVNLTGAFLMSQAAIPVMTAQGSGVIIHVASQLGHVGAPGRAVYGATKAALMSLARTMALDHGPDGIRVASISPGAVLTERLEALYGSYDAASDALSDRYITGRLGEPAEIAAAAAYLASDEAAFLTGTDLLIDGGYTTG